ncbi:hypothetical protein GH714_008799 [Hevea brasiliensis]|uniref:DNA-directed RNA polymerase n=1 Tax=Hevea brasiliensis TaxID=3981 RepID=A0A6A6MKZ0_HEVBR|nr:hypothetical protein GH714_008799 [Hevea brasiliensis]
MRPIEHYLDASIVTNGLSRSFSSGAWSHPYKRMERMSGVVANLGPTNPLQTMVDLRKTRQQVQYTVKVGGARYQHPSHWGRVCFRSTPGGENCGLVKDLASTGLVSTNISEPLIDILFDCGMEKIVNDTHTKLNGKYIVFLNGEWVGVCENSNLFVAKLRRLRWRKQLPQQSDHVAYAGFVLCDKILLISLTFFVLYSGRIQSRGLLSNESRFFRARYQHIRSYKADVDDKELLDKRQKFDDTVNFGKIQSKTGRVDSLDNDGFPFIGANLQSGDIVIGRCAESGANHGAKLKHTERGMVQKVTLSSNDEGKNFAVVSLRQANL